MCVVCCVMLLPFPDAPPYLLPFRNPPIHSFTPSPLPSPLQLDPALSSKLGATLALKVCFKTSFKFALMYGRYLLSREVFDMLVRTVGREGQRMRERQGEIPLSLLSFLSLHNLFCRLLSPLLSSSPSSLLPLPLRRAPLPTIFTPYTNN